MSDDGVTLRSARVEDARALTQIMFDEVPWARLRDFGMLFNTLLHRQWIRSKYGVVVVVEKDGQVIGYGAGLSDTKRFHRAMKWKYGWLMALVLLPKMLKKKNRETLMRAFTYFPEAPEGDPRAELVSLNVSSKQRQAGLGRMIYNALMDGLKKKGVGSVKLGHVDTTKETANKFWLGVGARYLRTEKFYSHNEVNVYVYDIPEGRKEADAREAPTRA